MITLKTDIEREALDMLERQLTSQGYTLVREPSGADLPQFVGTFQPDAIAIDKRPNLLIEIITRRRSGSAEAAKIEQLQSLLASQPDWQLKVVYATQTSPFPNVATVGAIRARYDAVKDLSRIDRPAALIMAWSLLEAVTRAIQPEQSRGVAPASVVEFLTSLGYIVQSEANTLRSAAQKRNLIVHGDVSVDISTVELAKVFEIIGDVLGAFERQDSD